MAHALLMRSLQQLIWVLVLIVSLGLAQAEEPRAAPASGEEAAARSRRLDQLFVDLKSTKMEEDGDRLVAEIWQLWLQSGRPEIDALLQQALAMLGQGRADLAMPILDEIVARAPEWAEGWNKRATVLYLHGEHDRSLADIDRVLALEPRHFGALAGTGLIRMAREEYRESLAAFRRALAVNPFLEERFGLIPALEKKVGEKPI